MALRLDQVQKQTQKLIMSPQMQQAIHLLQLPLVELSTLIEQEMMANPALEEVLEGQDLTPEKAKREETGDELDFQEEFSHLAQVDDEWREYYQQAGSYARASEDEERRRRFYEDSITTPESLQEHLLKQWRLAANDDRERELGDQIIGNIDENGYLAISLEELASGTGSTVAELERMLKIVQTFHPVGVGARTLKECLLLQLFRLGKGEGLEARIVEGHLEDLGKKNFAAMAKALGAETAEVQRASEWIATLEPKPGRIFDPERTQYATPDVIVEKAGEEFVVMLNDERIPHLRISNLYRELMKDKGLESQTKDYIRQKVQAGQWLVKNIQLRQQTLYNIATVLVREQREFLENGIAFLRPLTMQKVAEQVGIHESTVSRAIANKHMSTPKGLFQMKYFFTPGLQTQAGENISTARIKEMIGDFVSKENSGKPLSDREIVDWLKTKGLDVARRTVTKYRKELKIPPSNLRKKF